MIQPNIETQPRSFWTFSCFPENVCNSFSAYEDVFARFYASTSTTNMRQHRLHDVDYCSSFDWRSVAETSSNAVLIETALSFFMLQGCSAWLETCRWSSNILPDFIAFDEPTGILHTRCWITPWSCCGICFLHIYERGYTLIEVAKPGCGSCSFGQLAGMSLPQITASRRSQSDTARAYTAIKRLVSRLAITNVSGIRFPRTSEAANTT